MIKKAYINKKGQKSIRPNAKEDLTII